jgi:hypothetical protein
LLSLKGTTKQLKIALGSIIRYHPRLRIPEHRSIESRQ